MSYDYVALVEEISSNRRRATKLDDAADRDGLLLALQESLKAMETLSCHCPMTPLLWMKYAWDTSRLIQVAVSNNSNEGKLAALQTRLQTLELGLAEFPGSSILHLHYVELLLASCMEEDVDKKRQALESAIQLVGRGSHRQDGEIIAQLYRLYAHFLAKQGDFAGACAVWLERAQTPVQGANDSFADEFGQFCKLYKQDPTPYMAQIELARRSEAKLNSLVQFEQDVEFAMMQEQIRCESCSSLIEVDNVGNPLPMNSDFLREGEHPPSHWMGLGGMLTADAFRKYAQACRKFQLPSHQTEGDEEESEATIQKQEDKVHQLTTSVYERGVAECPTVESLWQSYIQHLFYELETIQESAQDDPSKAIQQVAEQLRRVTARAVRNCPYSLSLFQKKLQTFLIVANLGHAVLEPDDIMQTVQEALDAKFLQNPGQCVDLYLSAIRVVKQRIMFLVAKAAAPDGLAYDEGESPTSEKKMAEQQQAALPSPLDDARLQDLQDLCEDLREIYDVADEQLRKRHLVWTEGRSLLWQDKAVTETFLIAPLMQASQNDTKAQQQSLLRKAYERLVRVHQPPHPDSYQSYINFLYSTIMPQQASVSRLQKIRGVYQKALHSVGKSKRKLDPPPYSTMTVVRDYETALCSLCHEYLNFERCFGSEKSIKLASLAVQKKMEKADIETTASNKEEPNEQVDSVEQPQATSLKRKHDDPVEQLTTSADDQSLEPAVKKHKGDSNATSDETPVEPRTPKSDENVHTAEVSKPTSPKVKVGNLMYPAHPFTVRISNLSNETEDMDLVDLLRPRCGAIVHARIIRDKKGGNKKASSKGWALVQFEERESVESALQLNDVLGIHEKVISVERSHMPAVSVIPPGMHRVQPQGEGKSTKRNQKRKDQRKEKKTHKQQPGTESEAPPTSSVSKEEDNEKKQTTSAASILAFRPRGVTHKGNKKAHPKPRLKLETNETDK